MSGLGLGALGVGVAGSAVGLQAHAITTSKLIREAVAAGKALGKSGEELTIHVFRVTRQQAFYSATSSMKGFKILATGSKFGLIAEPAVIQAAFSIVTSIAVDQLIEIQTAKAKLEEAIAEAREPVDLKALLAETNGRDHLAFFWAKAIDGPSGSDPSLQAKAAAAQQQAAQRGYQLAGAP